MTEAGPLAPPPRGLSPRGRLILGCVLAVGGGILTLVALQADWQQVICSGPLATVPGGGSVRVGQRVSGVSGASLAGWLMPLTVLVAVLPAMALLADRRLRAALLALTALLALAVMIGVFAVPSGALPIPRMVGCRAPTSAWRSVAFGGGVVALAGISVASKPAAVVPKLGLPERPPSEVEP